MGSWVVNYQASYYTNLRVVLILIFSQVAIIELPALHGSMAVVGGGCVAASEVTINNVKQHAQ